MTVICDQKSETCPATCRHGVAHEPIFDMHPQSFESDWTETCDSFCTEWASPCGHRRDRPDCKCVEVAK